MTSLEMPGSHLCTDPLLLCSGGEYSRSAWELLLCQGHVDVSEPGWEFSLEDGSAGLGPSDMDESHWGPQKHIAQEALQAPASQEQGCSLQDGLAIIICIKRLKADVWPLTGMSYPLQQESASKKTLAQQTNLFCSFILQAKSIWDQKLLRIRFSNCQSCQVWIEIHHST